jgi:ribosomal protein S1
VRLYENTFRKESLKRLMAKAATITMDELLASEDASLKQITQGEIVDGTVLIVRKHEILVDLGPHGIGLVPRREIGFSRALAEGDEVSASIVDS